MKLIETPLPGAYLIETYPKEDERGFYARGWCRNEFEARGLSTPFVCWNFSFSKKKGTLRGLHYQLSPHEEIKLVRCLRGALFDVIIDLRKDSPTYKSWFGIELRSEESRYLYIPQGMAHGYQTLQDNTEMHYLLSGDYQPEFERGIRWNDPVFKIKWPQVAERVISPKDQNLPDYSVIE